MSGGVEWRSGRVENETLEEEERDDKTLIPQRPSLSWWLKRAGHNIIK